MSRGKRSLISLSLGFPHADSEPRHKCKEFIWEKKHQTGNGEVRQRNESNHCVINSSTICEI